MSIKTIGTKDSRETESDGTAADRMATFDEKPKCIKELEEYPKQTNEHNAFVDCSLIAKQYGGGGHKGASGFVLTNEQFIKFMNETHV